MDYESRLGLGGVSREPLGLAVVKIAATSGPRPRLAASEPSAAQVKLHIDHGYDAVLRGMRGENPPGVLLDHRGKKMRSVDEGDTLHFTLTELLNAVGIESLDSPNTAGAVAESVGSPTYFRGADISQASRGGAAAATWIVHGDESRRRRGRDVDSPWRRVAATGFDVGNFGRRRRASQVPHDGAHDRAADRVHEQD